jgi:hypothetical protein
MPDKATIEAAIGGDVALMANGRTADHPRFTR